MSTLPRFVLVLISLAYFAPPLRSQDLAVDKLKPQKYELAGNRWLQFGSGIIASARSARLVRISRKDIAHSVREYDVRDPQGVSLMQAWLRTNALPLFGTTRPGNVPEALSHPRVLYVYSSEKPEKTELDTTLLWIPLDFVFENFSDEKFDQLIKDWKAVEVR